MSQFGEGLLRTALQFNPMTAPMELLRWSLWGSTTIDPASIVISLATTFVVLFCGIVLFNKVERTFMDTV
jgi:lipopolysaccharide transport system permease protein